MSIQTPAQVAESVRHDAGYALDEIPGIDGWRIQSLLVEAIEADRAQRAEIDQDWRDDQEAVREADFVQVEVLALYTREDGKEQVLWGTDLELTAAQAVGMFQGIGEAS